MESTSFKHSSQALEWWACKSKNIWSKNEFCTFIKDIHRIWGNSMQRTGIGMEYFLCLAAYFEFLRVGKCVDYSCCSVLLLSFTECCSFYCYTSSHLIIIDIVAVSSESWPTSVKESVRRQKWWEILICTHAARQTSDRAFPLSEYNR